MTDHAYIAFQREHKQRLTMKVEAWGASFREDAFSAIEPSGSISGMQDSVCELHVLKVFSRSASTTAEALKALDAYAPILVGTLGGGLTDMEVYSAQSRWVEGWRRRLEKLQRENPNVG